MSHVLAKILVITPRGSYAGITDIGGSIALQPIFSLIASVRRYLISGTEEETVMRATQDDTRSFIASHSAELAKLAIDARLDTLAFVLQMAMHEAGSHTVETMNGKTRKAA